MVNAYSAHDRKTVNRRRIKSSVHLPRMYKALEVGGADRLQVYNTLNTNTAIAHDKLCFDAMMTFCFDLHGTVSRCYR
jgi:hypothetical protein